MAFETQSAAFLEWLLSRHVEVSPKVEIADFRAQGQGRGLVALEDIDEDEELFRLPRNVLLNAANNSLVEDHPELKEKIQDLTQWEALIVVLLYEWKCKGSSSPWAPYFEVLPINDTDNYIFNQLVFWNEQEIQKLEPSLVVLRIGKDTASDMYTKLFPQIVVEEYGVSELKTTTQLEFNRIASLIMSYSFDVEASQTGEEDEESEESDIVRESGYLKSMVPLADTLNADTKLHNASLMYTPTFLVMRSIKSISKGEQVFNTYSDHPNAELLRRYGYVEQQGSAHDFGEIPLELVKEYFSKHTALSADSMEDIVNILREIEDEEEEEFVLEAFDCYFTGAVNFELIFLVQLLTVVAGVNEEKSFNEVPYEVKTRATKRIYKKCYQLVESGKLTIRFSQYFQGIIEERMARYPEYASQEFKDVSPKLSRPEMAEIALKSEFRSLKNCFDSEKVVNAGEAKYSCIDDNKLLRNILKKDIFEADQPNKKQKRTFEK